MEKWYRVSGYKAHQGTGNKQGAVMYIFAENIMDVLNRYKKVPGIKRSRYRDIIPLSEKQTLTLENIIINSGKISLEKAKRTWFYGHGIKFY